ncbi:DUF4365 domain-containing protein [Corynebacterium flavescens]|uniref:DUF4365 domain-containing protein n=1 Tax=Corynebacterium flavescens TaxID=28028 RepID=UPI0028A1BDC5|nr:DUF4365 domain-containing protein [Corynebacterium flavescens]
MKDGDAALSENGIREALSINYTQQVVANEGFSFNTNSQDYIAIDGTIEFPETDLRVQLKSTSQVGCWNNSSFDFRLEPSWIQKWARNTQPVILIMVVLNPNLNWVTIRKSSASLAGRGYWKRVDNVAKETTGGASATITFSKEDLVCRESVEQWRSLVANAYGKEDLK